MVVSVMLTILYSLGVNIKKVTIWQKVFLYLATFFQASLTFTIKVQSPVLGVDFRKAPL